MISLDLSSARWRKSSRSTDTGGDCVEVADVAWVKSSHSADTGGDCVEVAALDPAVAVRDSKDPDGPKLVFAAGEWRTFITGIKQRR